MEKKRSVGVMVVGTTMLIFGLLCFFLAMKEISSYTFQWDSISHNLTVNIPLILMSLSGLIFIMSSSYLLRLRNWARKLSIWYSVILLIYSIPYMLFFMGSSLVAYQKELTHSPFYKVTGDFRMFVALFSSPFVIFPLIFIFQLTRPKAKEQFR